MLLWPLQIQAFTVIGCLAGYSHAPSCEFTVCSLLNKVNGHWRNTAQYMECVHIQPHVFESEYTCVLQFVSDLYCFAGFLTFISTSEMNA